MHIWFDASWQSQKCKTLHQHMRQIHKIAHTNIWRGDFFAWKSHRHKNNKTHSFSLSHAGAQYARHQLAALLCHHVNTHKGQRCIGFTFAFPYKPSRTNTTAMRAYVQSCLQVTWTQQSIRHTYKTALKRNRVSSIFSVADRERIAWMWNRNVGWGLCVTVLDSIHIERSERNGVYWRRRTFLTTISTT